MSKTLPLEIFDTYFSGYSDHAIEINGVVYPTLEHAYHCLRYSNQKIVEEILSTKNPFLAWSISQKYKNLQLADFPYRKLKIMKELIELKTSQHDDVRMALLDSKDLKIVKHITKGAPADGFWDDGEDGKGLNNVGKIWMEVRSKLREQN